MSKSTARRLGARMRTLRAAAGLSQESLADRAGMDRTYLGGIERGERNPSLQNIIKIADALEIGLSDLFHDVHPPPSPQLTEGHDE